MNINDFFKKYPEKSLNDYYLFLRDSQEDSSRPSDDSAENKVHTDEDSLSSFYNFNDEVQSAKQFAWYLIGAWLLFICYGVLNYNPARNDDLSEGEQLAQEAIRCLESRKLYGDIFFKDCQKDIRMEAAKLDPAEQRKYNGIIFTQLKAELNKKSEKFNFLDFAKDLGMVFILLALLGITTTSWLFFVKVEPEFKNWKIIESELTEMLNFYKNNPEIFSRLSNIRDLAQRLNLFRNNRKTSYKIFIKNTVSRIFIFSILLMIYFQFVQPELIASISSIRFSDPNLYSILSLCIVLFPLIAIILGLFYTENRQAHDQFVKIKPSVRHYLEVTKNPKFRVFTS